MRRILVVDDEADLLTVLSMALELNDYRPTTAADGEEALAMLHSAKDSGDPFGAMLLDMAMPRVDGWHVLRHVRRDPDLKSLPVVAVTGKATSLDERSRMAAYGAIFVDKRINYVSRVIEIVNGLCAAAPTQPGE